MHDSLRDVRKGVYRLDRGVGWNASRGAWPLHAALVHMLCHSPGCIVHELCVVEVACHLHPARQSCSTPSRVQWCWAAFCDMIRNHRLACSVHFIRAHYRFSQDLAVHLKHLNTALPHSAASPATGSGAGLALPLVGLGAAVWEALSTV